MKVQCDVCAAEAASVFCCADEAALCDACDRHVHRANKLAGKHRRFSLLHPCSSSSSAAAHKPPLCDICQERRGFLFCKEDRAILCRECDAPVHSASDMTRRHSRFLLTGVRLSSAPVDSAGPSEEEEQENSRSPCNGDSCSSGGAGATTATASDGSSISEYLTKTLPGWHVEDFLIDDASAGDVGACSDGLYQVMVSIHNYQMYRHIERPGWRLSWTWSGKEVIWSTTGAETTEQGDCSRVGGGGNRPHCCQKRPVMVDLPPGTPYNMQVANCCRGGVLSSLVQSNLTFTAAFQMVVGDFALARDSGGREPEKPWQFDMGVPGYTCSNATTVAPTRIMVDKNRYVQALLTWQVTCSYSQYRASAAPSCCVSMTTFYSETIVDCPRCSCGCQGSPPSPQCVSIDQQQPGLPAGGDDEPSAPPIVWCSEHMCPIRVHWHVKTNYRKYWRVKVTVSNYNLAKNYSDWNLVLQHPNLRSLTQLFSFNYRPLVEYGAFNDTGMFWGLRYYNEMLLQDGNVQTEMILEKESDFTYSGGWAFPRRVYFNGQECVMPPADQYPVLPNGASALRGSVIAGHCFLLLLFFLLV